MDTNGEYGCAPIAVGGVGGSGTRLVAQILRSRGVYLGCDLNDAGDTLWFTLLFKRREILQCDDLEFDLLTRTLEAGLRANAPLTPQAFELLDRLSRQDRPQHSAGWLRQRVDSLIQAARGPVGQQRWGWKEPNTHMVIERLWQRWPDIRYVHVVRHGLAMANSRNQNQLQLWGKDVLGEDGPVTSARSLSYWCKVHQRMQSTLARNAERMFWLDYDTLCRDPGPALEELCAFLELPVDSNHDSMGSLIQQQPFRWARQATDGFASVDLEYVRSLGYPIQ